MRKVAGILMVIGAIIGVGVVRVIYLLPPESLVPFEGPLKWVSMFWAMFVALGGVYTFKGRFWALCLVTGILIIPISVIPFLAWSDVLANVSGDGTSIPLAILITLFFLTTAILPIVSLRLKKGEWVS